MNSASIHQINDFEISQFCSCIRKYLYNLGYQELRLSNIVTYSVTNTNSISLSDSCYLRYTPEPEIWETGRYYERFFSIVSLFRNEDKKSNIHKNEFSIIDSYQSNSDVEQMMGHLMGILSNIETELNLIQLSNLPCIRVSYEQFCSNAANLKRKVIYHVEKYPISESFFDRVNEDTETTTKSELFAVLGDGQVIEFGVLGKVDKNANDQFRVVNKTVNFDFNKYELFGGCLGIERLILIYKLLTNESREEIL